MEDRLKALEEDLSLTAANMFADELADIDNQEEIEDDSQQRILSSVMRKAGYEMNETIQIKRTEKRKTDNDKEHIAEIARVSHGGAVAACLAVVLVGTIGAGLIFGQGVDIDEPVKPKSSLVTEPPADSGERKIQDWAKPYLEQNPETVGYLKIEGLRDSGDLESPVVQHNDNEYYLTHGFDNEPSEAGAIFADSKVPINENGQPSNIILYGQNMRVNSDNADDVMFSSLMKYKDSTFFATHQTIDFSTVYDEPDTKYQVISCLNAYVDEGFEYWKYRDFDSEHSFDAWIENVKERAINKSYIDCTETDDYLTLVTTEPGEDGRRRFIVVAKKMTETNNTADEATQYETSQRHLNKDHRYDLEYDEEKEQYYDVTNGEYLSEEQLEEYWKEIQKLENEISKLDKKEALKALEASFVEYEISEPGQSVDVEPGHVYRIFNSYEHGLQIYFSREVEGVPETSDPYSDEARDLYEKAGFKVLDLTSVFGGWSSNGSGYADYSRVICEDYIKTPEQVSKEIIGLMEDKAEDIVCRAGFHFIRKVGEPSEYDTCCVYKTDFSNGDMTCYLSAANINNPWIELAVPIPEGGLNGSYEFGVKYHDDKGIYTHSPEDVILTHEIVEDPEGGTEVKLEFEEKTPMFVTVYVEYMAPGSEPVSMTYAEYYVENGEITLLGEPYAEGLKELNNE